MEAVDKISVGVSKEKPDRIHRKPSQRMRME